jgi:hypothetical protein
VSAARGAAGFPGGIDFVCCCDRQRQKIKIALKGSNLFVKEARDCACSIEGVADAELVDENGSLVMPGYQAIRLDVPERDWMRVFEEFTSRVIRGNPPMILNA